MVLEDFGSVTLGGFMETLEVFLEASEDFWCVFVGFGAQVLFHGVRYVGIFEVFLRNFMKFQRFYNTKVTVGDKS